jgi:nucleotide-binding universal stress UspA family protein/N-acetylglutamate synthase-like GNAT family acetyltransferase
MALKDGIRCTGRPGEGPYGGILGDAGRVAGAVPRFPPGNTGGFKKTGVLPGTVFPRVLLPVDFSPYTTRTVQCIGEIPGVREIILLHVLEPGPDLSTAYGQQVIEARVRERLGRLEELKAGMGGPGREVRPLVHERFHDDVAGTILAVAERERADLIALGARGRTLRSLLLGSVSAEVLANARTGVLVVHDRALDAGKDLEKYCRSSLERVLCPVDFSRPSLDTVEALPSLGNIGEVILLHVLGEELAAADRGIAAANARNRLAALKEGLEKGVLRVRTLVTTGKPAPEILRVAEAEDATLVVLARFGKRDYVQAVGIGPTASEVGERARQPVLVRYPRLHYEVVTRELAPGEFPVAEEIWLRYHQQKTDRGTDRLFATFADGVPAGVARCRRHPDGLEVDGVFVLPEFRNRGYARRLMDALVPACGRETLYMHSTLELVPFYRSFGFEPIPEAELPRTIRERYSFALGDLRSAQVQPMRRKAG